jgi:hypothetical protein
MIAHYSDKIKKRISVNLLVLHFPDFLPTGLGEVMGRGRVHLPLLCRGSNVFSLILYWHSEKRNLLLKTRVFGQTVCFSQMSRRR